MHDVLIIGAGPAGLSAARWCDELGLDVLVLEQNEEVGGQLLSVYNPIENYLGVRAANGRDLWHVNVSAPHLLRPATGEFAAQTRCAPASEAMPT